jgi:hypothetical protein
MNRRLTSASEPHLPTSMIKNAPRQLRDAVNAYLIIEVGVGGRSRAHVGCSTGRGCQREASGSQREASGSQRDLVAWKSLLERLGR